METNNNNPATTETLLKEFKEHSALVHVKCTAIGKEVYLEKDAWSLRSIKSLIPILEKYDITFYVINDHKLLLYKLPVTVGDSKIN